MKRIRQVFAKWVDERLSTKLLRKDFAKRYLRIRMNAVGNIPSLDFDKKHSVDSYWKDGMGIKVNYNFFSLYNKVNEVDDFEVRYVPDDLFFCYIDPFYNNVDAANWLDDKNLYDLLFDDINRPLTIARKMGGTILDRFYKKTDIDVIIDQCKSLGEVVYKKSIESEGGKGVSIINSIEDTGKLQLAIQSSDNFVIQGIIKQHSTLATLHPDSINTIRVMTLIHNDEVYILSSIVRMGRGGKRVDNASSGGLFCGIDEEGCLRKYAYDYDGYRYERHPSTNIVFEGHHIPGVEEIHMIVKKQALKLMRFCKMVSWDFAIDENGIPIFIEVNMTYGEVNFHQMTNGPLFKDLTKDVIREVFADSKKRLLQRLY